ncbi:hypothetical protein BS78_01G148100 [Paspalum vaginatum]|nr:hypothetical protein BS78_01G148100 [Paspalum vaginatum]
MSHASSSSMRFRGVYCPNYLAVAHLVPQPAQALGVAPLAPQAAAVEATNPVALGPTSGGMNEDRIIQHLKWLEKLVCVCILLVLYAIMFK